MATLDSPDSSLSALLRRPGVRQFVKFCIVGASSTVIDMGIYLLLMEGLRLDLHLGSLAMARITAKCISFAFAVSNGFIWNNRWTFQRAGAGNARARYGKFVLTNVVGLVIQASILGIVSSALPRSTMAHLHLPLHDPGGLVGNVAGIAVAVFWNFTASRLWTFNG